MHIHEILPILIPLNDGGLEWGYRNARPSSVIVSVVCNVVSNSGGFLSAQLHKSPRYEGLLQEVQRGGTLQCRRTDLGENITLNLQHVPTSGKLTRR